VQNSDLFRLGLIAPPIWFCLSVRKVITIIGVTNQAVLEAKSVDSLSVTLGARRRCGAPAGEREPCASLIMTSRKTGGAAGVIGETDCGRNGTARRV